MQTKSRIQLIRESLGVLENFRSSLEDLMNKYNIEDSIFVYNNGVYECTKGYFDVTGEYDNINEAIRNCNVTSMGIRIIGNKQYQTGYIRKMLSECKGDTVLDINALEIV